MDRSLKWRTVALVAITLFAVATLLPTFLPRGELPTWFTRIFSARMSMGLDLQGGLHLVYSIDLDKAVDDRASELKRDIESRFAEDGTKGAVKTPATPLGAVTVLLEEAAKRAPVLAKIQSDYGDTITMLECPKSEPAGAICFRVSSSYSDGIKKAALSNAVNMIRERINEKGLRTGKGKYPVITGV